MGRALDWSALPVLLDLLDVPDPELFIEQLAAWRDHVLEQQAAEHEE